MFVKGKSGNPSGRPKVLEKLKNRCVRAVDKTIVKAWIDECEIRERQVMTKLGPVTVKCRGPEWVRCSELLAGYAMGKPQASVDVTSAGDAIDGFTIRVVDGNGKPIG